MTVRRKVKTTSVFAQPGPRRRTSAALFPGNALAHRFGNRDDDEARDEE
jgi:hypothetical protein